MVAAPQANDTSKAVVVTVTNFRDLPPDEWLRQSFVYFRKIGFFSEFAEADVDEACAVITSRRGRPFNPHNPLADLVLLSFDPHSYWRGSMEKCGSRSGAYAEALAGWSDVSRGSFVATEIVEDYGRDSGKPTLVWFRLEGKRYVLFADHTSSSLWDDWLDLTVVDQLNIILANRVRQYFLFKQPFDDACVFCLTYFERQSLKYDRGWRFFFDPDDDENEKDYFRRFGIGESQSK